MELSPSAHAPVMIHKWDMDTGSRLQKGTREQGAASIPGVCGSAARECCAAGCVTVPSLPPQDWGIEMIFRNVKLPVLSIKNFVVETPHEKRRYKKWSTVTFPVEEFDYLAYCSTIHGQSL